MTIIKSLEQGDGQPMAALDALGRLAAQVTGAKLVTLMTVEDSGAERLWSNMPDVYPVSGRKPLNESYWSDVVVRNQQTFVANSIEKIAEVFPDHPLILSLGCESVMNLPIIVAGQVMGTINCLDGPGYWTAARLEKAEKLRLPGAAAYLLHRLMTYGATR